MPGAPTYGSGTYGGGGTLGGGQYPALVFAPPDGAEPLWLHDDAMTLVALRGTGLPEVRRQVQRPPLRDGAAIVRRRYESRFVDAEIAVAPGGWVALQLQRRALARAAAPKGGPGELIYRPHAADREYRIGAELDDGLRFGDLRGSLERIVISWRCPDPAWRVAPERVDTLVSPSAGIEVPVSVPVDLAAGGVTATLVNGDPLTEPVIESYPVIEFEAGSRGCAGPEIRNDTTGDRWAFLPTFELAAGEVLTLDMDRQTAVRGDGSSAIGARTADSSAWALVPGSNTIAAGQASREMTVRVRWWPRLAAV